MSPPNEKTVWAKSLVVTVVVEDGSGYMDAAQCLSGLVVRDGGNMMFLQVTGPRVLSLPNGNPDASLSRGNLGQGSCN